MLHRLLLRPLPTEVRDFQTQIDLLAQVALPFQGSGPVKSLWEVLPPPKHVSTLPGEGTIFMRKIYPILKLTFVGWLRIVSTGPKLLWGKRPRFPL